MATNVGSQDAAARVPINNAALVQRADAGNLLASRRGVLIQRPAVYSAEPWRPQMKDEFYAAYPAIDDWREPPVSEYRRGYARDWTRSLFMTTLPNGTYPGYSPYVEGTMIGGPQQQIAVMRYSGNGPANPVFSPGAGLSGTSLSNFRDRLIKGWQTLFDAGTPSS